MQVALRPYITTGIVIAGASALVAAPITMPPTALSPSTVAIAPTAAALDGAFVHFDSLWTDGGKSAEALLVETGELPGDLSRAFFAAVDDPHLLPSLGSAFLYGLLHSAPGSAHPSLAEADLLHDAFRALGALVAHSLPGLPSPAIGSAAMADVDLPHGVDVVTSDFALVGEHFGVAAAGVAAFIGNTPAEFADFLHAAAADPGNIPTLLSNTVLGAMSEFGNAAFGPMVCLLRDTLPKPLGDLVTKAVQEFIAVMPQPTSNEVSNDLEQTVLHKDSVGEQNVEGQGPQTLGSFAQTPDPGLPDVTKKDGAELSDGPRLNVFKVNPLAGFHEPKGVGENVAGSSTAPEPHLAGVVKRLAQAPAAIAHSIRDALTPHHTDAPADKDPEPSEAE
jgi:hypothetical protein